MTSTPSPIEPLSAAAFNPEVAAQLFNARRAWTYKEYAAMAEQSAVPLHRYRSDRPEWKDVTPLAFILFHAVMTPTARRIQRLPSAIRALAGPDLRAGPPTLTEGGALFASYFVSIKDDYRGVQIMASWRTQAVKHLLERGVDWEAAWREGPLCLTRAHQERTMMHSRWRRTDALQRWARTLRGETPVASDSEIRDPESVACLRLMTEWWTQATDWKAFPADFLATLAPTLSSAPTFRALLLERLRTWPTPGPAPMHDQKDVEDSVIETLKQVEHHTGPLTAEQLVTVGQAGLPALTAWSRQRQGQATPVTQPPRRRFRS